MVLSTTVTAAAATRVKATAGRIGRRLVHSGPSSRVLSGIQPTGSPHLGNYLGALSNWRRLQDQHQQHRQQQQAASASASDTVNARDNLLFMIVDLHALTSTSSRTDPAVLRSNVRQMAAVLLACGIDPSKSTIFRQSKIPLHGQLTWVLNCATPMGWLGRMTQWKSKFIQQQQQQQQSHDSLFGGLGLGLFAYPVLMAADILLYRATHIPVGADQKQHLELTRDIAQVMNTRASKSSKFKPSHSYGYKGKVLFPLPEPIFTETKRVMSLREPTSKMSKSSSSQAGVIYLTDSATEINSKLRKAVTDSLPPPLQICGNLDEIEQNMTEGERHGMLNLYRIHAALMDQSFVETASQLGNMSHSQVKNTLAEVIEDKIGPLREELKRIEADPEYIEKALLSGEESASQIAASTWSDVERAIGL
ncbi:tryptophanyl-tRNA synthetase [Ramicandelaber brevisporus]|nr:tryptophanyl-tRNA synthetase [Ramicandelaber brevisporus]